MTLQFQNWLLDPVSMPGFLEFSTKSASKWLVAKDGGGFFVKYFSWSMGSMADLKVLWCLLSSLLMSSSDKGQLISEKNCSIFKSPEKRTKVLKEFCPSL